MSRRGAARGRGPRGESPFEFMEAPAIGRTVLAVAKALRHQGLSPAEVASLFTHAAAVLVQQEDGMDREEWLALCEELHDASATEEPAILNAPGGAA
jgi:hypothetical protein